MNYVGAIAGLCYGMLLLWLGVALTDAGHGTYLPLFLFGSPISIFGIAPSLVGIPIVWCVIGAFTPSLKHRHCGNRSLAARLIAAHYIGIVIVMFINHSSEAEYTAKVLSAIPNSFGFAVLLYLLGNLVFWWRMNKSIDSEH